MVANDSNDDYTKSFVALTKDTKVGHYQIVEKIGAGGIRKVYIAKDTKLKRQVTMKFLTQHLTASYHAKLRFTRESQAAALKHPNISTVYEVSEYQGHPFFCYGILRWAIIA